MLSALRRTAFTNVSKRGFATTSRLNDVAKLILVGRLGRDPEVRTTRTEKEYVSYTVATTHYNTPPNSDGTRGEPRTTWHHVLSFNANSNNYLRNMQKGSLVYVEAGYELREADPNADPDTPAGQRQIFLRHESMKLLKLPQNSSSSSSDTSDDA